MTDYRNPADLEPFLRARIAEKSEQDKLDLKRDLMMEDKKEKLNLVRLISSFANTESDLYEDHGFLIYGADKDQGRITQHCEILKGKGTDKLQSEMVNLLKGYLFPLPSFEVYAFEEPGVGTWGAIVIHPQQLGPFVFRKESDNWRVGEWRVRRGAQVATPEFDDYLRMQKRHTESHLRPIQQKLDALTQQMYVLQGELKALRRSEYTNLQLDLKPSNIVLRSHQEYLKQAKNSPEGKQLQQKLIAFQEIPVPSSRPGGLPTNSAIDNILNPTTFLKDYKVPAEDIQRVQNAYKFLGLHVPEEKLSFRVYTDMLTGIQIGSVPEVQGPDQYRFKAFMDLQQPAEDFMTGLTEQARLRKCIELNLLIHNRSTVTAQKVKIAVSVESGGTLLEYLPQKRKSQTLNVPFSFQRVITESQKPDLTGIVKRDSYSKMIDIIPSQDFESLTIPVEVQGAGMLQLKVRLSAANLTEPQEEVIEIPVVDNNDSKKHPQSTDPSGK